MEAYEDGQEAAAMAKGDDCSYAVCHSERTIWAAAVGPDQALRYGASGLAAAARWATRRPGPGLGNAPLAIGARPSTREFSGGNSAERDAPMVPLRDVMVRRPARWRR